MITRNGTDTVIGFIPGADIDEGTGAVKGGLGLAPLALQKLAGWKGTLALGGYTYPAGGTSEDWDFQKALGFKGQINYKAFAIPNGLTIADVRAGKADAIWTTRAQNMVKEGQGSCSYSPGYEGSDKNFNGSAGQPVAANTLNAVVVKGITVLGAVNWAYAISRQVNVMRKVTGWDCWFDVNYDVTMAAGMGLDPDPFRLITETFQSIGTECYPNDDWHGTWSAATDETSLLAYLTKRMAVQVAACKKYAVPLIIGETGPMIRTDTHASGDDPAFIQWLHDFLMDTTNNVAAAFLYNGTTGDTSRVFLWNQATGTYTVDKVKFPKSAAAIIALFDPANFVGRIPPIPPNPAITFSQAQVDAAVKAAVDPLTIRLTTAQGQVTTLTGQITGLTGQVSTLTGQVSQLAACTAQVIALQDQVTLMTGTLATQLSQVVALQGQIAKARADLA